ncbi:MAG: hypothetical protein BVN32_12090 [Proteobacteria bacterium ST_bin14]|nr:MAG: hypothetical protein BVN32_12090 [Proteobacteria bacterium ST_bin14]
MSEAEPIKPFSFASPAEAEASAEIVEISSAKIRLIRVAMGLFSDRGFDGVTVRDISTAADVSVGLINHHFGSKDGLREAVDKYFMGQFTELLFEYRYQGALDAKLDVDWIVANTEAWIDRHIDEWDVSRAYLRRALLEGSEWGHGLFDRFYHVVRTWTDQLDAAGQIRTDVDRLWLPFLMIYMDMGTLLLEPYVERTLGKSGFDRALWRRRHQAYTRLVIEGINPREN